MCGQTVADIWQFNGFPNVGRPPYWISEIQIFLTVGAVKRSISHQRTKFRKDRSNRCGNIAIFVIFKMAVQKLEILTICPLKGRIVRHRAKFHQNRSNG